MQGEEIRRKIASFPTWHYQLDLKGNLTPIHKEDRVNRHRQRKEYFFDPLVDMFGGSLAGKRVLDLGCNAGFWSLCAAQAGCDYVLGLDGRQMHIDQANFVFEVNEIEDDRYDFVAANLFDVDLRRFGTFDVVLCLGLMYHISKPVDLMEKISEVNSDVLLIDTTLSTVPGSYLEIKHDHLEKVRHAVDYELVMHPTWEAVHDLVRQFGYSSVALEPRFEDYEGAYDYRNGRRRAFLCAKQTDVSQASAETEQSPPAKPAPSTSGSPGNREDARRLIRWMQQTDAALSELFSSRRWKLANAFGEARRRVLRRRPGPKAEDQLLEVMRKFRTWQQETGHNSPRRGPARGSGERG
jgi:2-polyprenyl-3-methyl-5-hydroxy-6-metoxy-1,4-benzoquinol methylase